LEVERSADRRLFAKNFKARTRLRSVAGRAVLFAGGLEMIKRYLGVMARFPQIAGAGVGYRLPQARPGLTQALLGLLVMRLVSLVKRLVGVSERVAQMHDESMSVMLFRERGFGAFYRRLDKRGLGGEGLRR
jgi:hypothetical protein